MAYIVKHKTDDAFLLVLENNNMTVNCGTALDTSERIDIESHNFHVADLMTRDLYWIPGARLDAEFKFFSMGDNEFILNLLATGRIKGDDESIEEFQQRKAELKMSPAERAAKALKASQSNNQDGSVTVDSTVQSNTEVTQNPSKGW